MIEKTYQPADIEARISSAWEQEGAFKAGRPDRRDEQPYTIVIPPPNVTGSLHMGHALNNTLQDVLCRFERMRGRDVLWQPGTDHAGIATQMVVERQLMERQEPGRRDAARGPPGRARSRRSETVPRIPSRRTHAQRWLAATNCVARKDDRSCGPVRDDRSRAERPVPRRARYFFHPVRARSPRRSACAPSGSASLPPPPFGSHPRAQAHAEAVHSLSAMIVA